MVRTPSTRATGAEPVSDGPRGAAQLLDHLAPGGLQALELGVVRQRVGRCSGGAGAGSGAAGSAVASGSATGAGPARRRRRSRRRAGAGALPLEPLDPREQGVEPSLGRGRGGLEQRQLERQPWVGALAQLAMGDDQEVDRADASRPGGMARRLTLQDGQAVLRGGGRGRAARRRAAAGTGGAGARAAPRAELPRVLAAGRELVDAAEHAAGVAGDDQVDQVGEGLLGDEAEHARPRPSAADVAVRDAWTSWSSVVRRSRGTTRPPRGPSGAGRPRRPRSARRSRIRRSTVGELAGAGPARRRSAGSASGPSAAACRRRSCRGRTRPSRAAPRASSGARSRHRP